MPFFYLHTFGVKRPLVAPDLWIRTEFPPDLDPGGCFSGCRLSMERLTPKVCIQKKIIIWKINSEVFLISITSQNLEPRIRIRNKKLLLLPVERRCWIRFVLGCVVLVAVAVDVGGAAVDRQAAVDPSARYAARRAGSAAHL